jgi:Hemocyanin, ig-like domain
MYYTDLIIGENFIKRYSKDYFWSVKDRTTYSELYKNLMMAIDGKSDFIYDMSEAHCGFPDRLLLPKGKFGGMPYTFYFIVTPFTSTEKYNYDYFTKFTCGVGSGMKYFDNFAMGYPFDRPIDFLYFMTPNMYFKDVMIYHMDMDIDMNATHDMKYYPTYDEKYSPKYEDKYSPKYVPEYKEYKPKSDYYYKKPMTKYV